MQKNGVTLLELLIVIIVIAILVSVGVPVYTYRIERTRGERAIANIELIKDALKMYRIKAGTEPTYSIGSLADINNNLNLDLSDSYFTYNISNQTTFRRIEAIRNAGSSRWIRYNLDPIAGTTDQWDPAEDANKWPWHPQ